MPFLYEELSYDVIGLIYDVYNELGFGFKEKVYQAGIEKKLMESGKNYRKEVYQEIIINDEVVGKRYFDFVIEEKIVLELKRDNIFKKRYIDQLYEYLVAGNYQLGLLVCITPQGIKIKRILNIY